MEDLKNTIEERINYYKEFIRIYNMSLSNHPEAYLMYLDRISELEWVIRQMEELNEI